MITGKSGKSLSIIIAILLWTTLSYGEPDYTKIPVFFVHGHGMTAECWNPMISYLIKSGYPREYLKAIQLYPNNGPNIEAAENQIAPAIEKFLERINSQLIKTNPNVSSKTKVHLISHSMGALSARWYAAKVRPSRVSKWVSLGGAHHGSNVLCAWWDPGARDLCPAFAKNEKEGRIQYILNGEPHLPETDETPYGIGVDSAGVNSILPNESRRILYMSVRTSPDKWIKPEDSAVLDGAGGIKIIIPTNVGVRETTPGNILMMNRVGHDEMLEHPETLRLVEAILSQAK